VQASRPLTLKGDAQLVDPEQPLLRLGVRMAVGVHMGTRSAPLLQAVRQHCFGERLRTGSVGGHLAPLPTQPQRMGLSFVRLLAQPSLEGLEGRHAAGCYGTSHLLPNELDSFHGGDGVQAANWLGTGLSPSSSQIGCRAHERVFTAASGSQLDTTA